MSGCGSARLVAPIGVGAFLCALLAIPIAAQSPPGLRSTFDGDADFGRRPVPRRPGTKVAEPAAPAPGFGVLPGSGAGKSGFVSVKTKRKGRPAAPTTPGTPAATPLVLSPSGRVLTPDRLVPSDTSPPPARAPALATPAKVRPVLPPKPPALAQREEIKEQLNALPNTVVALHRPVEEDPFSQVGLRAGAFVLRPAIETTAGYDTNPGRVINGRGSAFVTPAAELAVRSNWVRHELAADIRGSYTAFDKTPQLDRPALEARVAGRVDVSERTRMLLEGRYLLAAVHPGTPDLPADLAKLPITTDVGATAGVIHRFNRLEVGLKGTFDRIQWQDSKLINGTIDSNKDRDYDQYGIQGRAGYELLPSLKPFVDVGADRRVHDLPVDFTGFRRDSEGWIAKGGAAFEITRTLTGEASIGYITRTYKDARLPDLRGTLVDASLLWAATGLTNVKLSVVTTPQETSLIGVSGILARDAVVQVDHAFRRWLIGSARFGYGLDEFVGSTREDQRYMASLGITYKLSRSLQVKGEVRKEWRRSNQPGNDYDATIGMVGLRWQP